MSLPGIRTALNVESGMQYLQQTAAAYAEDEDDDGGTQKAEVLPVKESSDVVFVRQRVASGRSTETQLP